MKEWTVRYSPDGEWEPLEDQSNDPQIIEGCLVFNYYDRGFRWREAVPLAPGEHHALQISGINPEEGSSDFLELLWVGEGDPPPAGDPGSLWAKDLASFISAMLDVYPDAESVAGLGLRSQGSSSHHDSYRSRLSSAYGGEW